MEHEPTAPGEITARREEGEVKRAIQRQQEIADFTWLMKMPQFRRFVWRMLEEAGVFRPTFRAGQPDLSAFLEGRRDHGLFVLREIHELTPEMYDVMVKEHKAHATR